MTAPSSVLRGVLVAFGAYAVFAFSDASIKILHGGVPAYQIAFVGAVFGCAALPFIKGRGDSWFDVLRSTNRPLWLLRFACGAIGAIASIITFTKLPMAEAFCLLFLLPSFVTILSVIFLAEDVRWQRWAAVIVGFIGVLVVLRPGFRELSVGHLAAAIGGLAAGNLDRRDAQDGSSRKAPVAIWCRTARHDYRQRRPHAVRDGCCDPTSMAFHRKLWPARRRRQRAADDRRTAGAGKPRCPSPVQPDALGNRIRISDLR